MTCSIVNRSSGTVFNNPLIKSFATNIKYKFNTNVHQQITQENMHIYNVDRQRQHYMHPCLSSPGQKASTFKYIMGEFSMNI